jgi:exopolysaccharide biosynthesis protein
MFPNNPRTVFGYYEPGHYAFLCVLGDRTVRTIDGASLGPGKSPGMSYAELSALCASLGMTAAYNFDGGGSSGMYWNEHQFGHNSRITGDILAVVD